MPWLLTASSLSSSLRAESLPMRCSSISKNLYLQILSTSLNFIFKRYFKQRSGKNPKARKEKGDDKDDDEEIGSDFESVADEEFDEYLAQSADFDFAADLKGKPKADKTKKKKKEDDEEDDEEEEGGADSDLEAAEMDSDEDFEGDEEFQDAFKDFDDMLNDTEPVKEDDDEPEDDGDSEEGFNEEDAEFSDGTFALYLSFKLFLIFVCLFFR